MNFTPDQERVIQTRNRNVLVSAAAGSGKTAVLVERIIGLITDSEHPVDIDRLLVVTFTNAAAAEMRERILRVITKRLEDEPDNVNLQRQSVLIHHAMITTIDSFCRFILLNHFQEISLDPGFMVGEPGKIRLMQKEALAKVMEASYAGEMEFYEGYFEDFIALTDAFSHKGQDIRIEEMTEQIFSFIMSQPYPETWMMQTLNDYEISGAKELLQSPFMQALYKRAIADLKKMCTLYDRMIMLCNAKEGPAVYAETLVQEQEMLEYAVVCKTYGELYEALSHVSFLRLPTAKKDSCSEDIKNQIQAIRNFVKERIKTMTADWFSAGAEEYAEDMQRAGKLLKPLLYLTKAFMDEFAADKAKENIIDFSDMEHFALKILIDQNSHPTETAKWYQHYFEAVMIDEYQDSNDVQELLLSAVSRENGEIPNRFMVGDMKQSIYKFRMARPEIFLEKYHTYGNEGEKASERIHLKQNFRSRKGVLSAVNHIFYPLMQAEIGGIDYDASAALYPGAVYPDDTEDNEEYRTEFLVFEKQGEADTQTELSAGEGEARVIASRIKRLLSDGRVTDKETGALRAVRYADIVILLRSVGSLANEIQDVLKKEGVPTILPGKTGYFSSEEIQILLQYLEICVNPYRDIPLAAVLKSPLFGFTDEELAAVSLIRSGENKKKTEEQAEEMPDGGQGLSLYEKMKLFDSDKAKIFIRELSELRKAAKNESVHDFLYKIISLHHYEEYVTALPGGGGRKENLEMLLEQAKMYEKNRMHGLFGFLRYMKQLEKYEIDYGSGNEDGADAVRIMTIHKSKGLEFPICFVSGLSGSFHRRDLSSPLLLHADYGIGLECRNYEAHTKCRTIKQRWIAEQLLIDSMGEELRVLYVALTRAGEKCILTGTVSNMEEALNKCSLLTGTETEKEVYKRKLDTGLMLDSNSYFKLLCYVFSIYRDHPDFLPEIYLYHEEDFLTEDLEITLENQIKKEALLHIMSETEIQIPEIIKDKINFNYQHTELEGLYNKTSVSQLKLAALHEDEQTYVLFDTEKKQNTVMQFMKQEEPALGATRGSAYHRLMELLDFAAFTQDSDEKKMKEKITDELEKQKEDILHRGLMTSDELELIDGRKIESFLESSLAREMVCAAKKGELFKEQPFVMEIPAKRADKRFPEDETMLIQGIIDAFYIKGNEVFLMDYKTDRVEKREDLITRYQVQLEYYKEALQKITKKQVVRTSIYSFYFSDTISL